MLTEKEIRFLAQCRVAHLATADRNGVPHVVPVCYAVRGASLFITIDDKPKRQTRLKRLENISENPQAAVTVDRYDEAWTRLGWVMLRGGAEVLGHGPEHDEAQDLLRARYPQLSGMDIKRHPVIALRIQRVTSWGNLSP